MKKRISIVLVICLALTLVFAPTSFASTGDIWAVPPTLEYYFVQGFSGGLAIVQTRNGFGADAELKAGVIDRTGREIVAPIQAFNVDQSHGIVVMDQGGTSGVFDNTGKEVVPLRTYSSVVPFDGGVYVFNSSTQQAGIIDIKTGNWIVPFGYYLFLGSVSDGMAVVQYDNNDGRRVNAYIDARTGREVMSFLDYDDDEYRYSYTLYEFIDGMAVVKRHPSPFAWDNFESALVDKAGNFVVPFSDYDFIGSFSDGLASVARNGKLGFIDSAGRLAIPLVYDVYLYQDFMRPELMAKFIDGVAIVTRLDSGGKQKFGLIDKTGKELTPFKYDEIRDYHEIRNFSDGVAIMMQLDSDGKQKFGLINKTGKELTPFKYDEIRDFSDGMAEVSWKNDAPSAHSYWGYIDKTGKEVIPPVYLSRNRYAGNFSDGLAVVAELYNDDTGSYHEKYRVIDKTGREIIPPGQYEAMGGVSEGLLPAKLNGKWGVLSVEKLLAAAGGATSATPTSPAANMVSPTPSKVFVNGAEQSFEAYLIGGNNYFKLRDLASVLNGTNKQFAVGYDDATKAVTMTTGQPYTAVGGEMVQGDGQAKAANPTPSKIYIDGRELNFTVYNIGGNNFFKLRDLMSALDVAVTYDETTRNIGVDTSQGYTPE